MPLTTPHTQYDAALPLWQRITDVLAGEDAVKAAAEGYVPRLHDQEDDEYAAYLARGAFFNGAARTVDGLLGAIFRKDPQWVLPALIQREQRRDLTLDGTSLLAFAMAVTERVIAYGRYGVLVDRAAGEGNSRPYVTGYPAADIVNWRVDRTPDGRAMPAQVVLHESVEHAGEDGFGVERTSQYRVLELVRIVEPDPVTGRETERTVYQVTLWRRESGGGFEGEWMIVDRFIPRPAGGRPIDYIPFVFFGPRGNTPDVAKPPLLDLVNTNLSHWRDAVDIAHGLHMTALPTPWASGWNTVGDGEGPGTVPLGPGRFLMLPDGAQAGMLEFSGAGLRMYMDERQEKRSQMAALGARMLEEPRPGVEAAETHRIRQAGEASALGTIATSVGLGMEAVLSWFAEWQGLPSENIRVVLNHDFHSPALAAADLTALFQVYQGGGMSLETFLWNLQRGEILQPDMSPEDELARLRATPAALQGGDPAPERAA